MTPAIPTTDNDLAVKVQQLEAQVNWFKEQFKLARHRQFGSSSEKIALQSELLFNEAEATIDSAPEVVEPQTITYTRKGKSVGHREEMLADLPTETIEYRLDEDEQVCEQCGGHMHEMSTESREELIIIPAQACYEYQLGRDGKYAARFLPAFAGYLHADGHAGYHDVREAKLVGCWAHVRRKFFDALIVVPEKHRDDPTHLSNIAIAKIKRLYDIEEELRGA